MLLNFWLFVGSTLIYCPFLANSLPYFFLNEISQNLDKGASARQQNEQISFLAVVNNTQSLTAHSFLYRHNYPDFNFKFLRCSFSSNWSSRLVHINPAVFDL